MHLSGQALLCNGFLMSQSMSYMLFLLQIHELMWQGMNGFCVNYLSEMECFMKHYFVQKIYLWNIMR